MAGKKENTEKFKTMIGGQALLEGIMMMGPEKIATVVRTKEGLHTKVEPRKVSTKRSVKKLPFIRGIFNFCASMSTGVRALMYSADFFAEDDSETSPAKQSKFDAWLEKKLSLFCVGHSFSHSYDLVFNNWGLIKIKSSNFDYLG